jgi:hypothetical protein
MTTALLPNLSSINLLFEIGCERTRSRVPFASSREYIVSMTIMAVAVIRKPVIAQISPMKLMVFARSGGGP